MFVDASALVAILNREEGAAELDGRIRNYDRPVYYSDLVVFEATQAVARVRAFTRSVTLKQNPEILTEALSEVTTFL